MLLKTDAPATDVPHTEYVTLRHRGFVRAGRENFRVLERVAGAKWSAVRLERDRLSANFQGSPLWPHEALARYPKLSSCLGLTGAAGADVCLLPDLDTANGFLRDAGLREFSFCGVRPGGDRAYVDAFIDRRVLPMADARERDSVHDWAYHFVTFLFPEFLENVRLNLEWIRGNLHLFEGDVTRDYVHYGHHLGADGKMKTEIRAETTSRREAVYRQMAVSLDVCTAKIVQILRVDDRGMLHRCPNELNIVRAFADGVTERSLEAILWLEPDLPLAPPAPDPARAFSEDAMEYLRAKLRELEDRCPTENKKRREFFTAFLADRESAAV